MDSENRKPEELEEEETSLKAAGETEEIEETEQKEEAPLPKPLFVAKTVLNGESQLEATNATTAKSAAVMSYVILGLCVAMFIALVVSFIMKQDAGNLVMGALLLLCIGFVIYNKTAAPKKAVQRWEGELIRAFGKPELNLITEFYDRSLIQTVEEQTDNIMDAGYSEIRDMKESEHLFLLKVNGRQWFFVAKDGFTQGDAESFREFMKQHLEAK